MPEPYNYTFQQPSGGVLQGFAQGIQVNQALQAQQDARQQAELQRAQEAQMRQDLGAVASNPTVASINQVMLKYPAVADKFKPALESVTAQQKDARVGRASDVYAALLGGRADVAKGLLEDHAKAYDNSGSPEEAKRSRLLAQMIDVGPAGAAQVRGIAGMFLSSALGPDKFSENFSKFEDTARTNELHPDLVKKGVADAAKAGSDAETAAAKAKVALPQALADLEKTGWDVKKIQNDIQVSREGNRIRLMEVALSRETNALKRDELALKVEEAKQKRDDLIREKTSAVADAQATIDNMLSTAQMALNTPMSAIIRTTGPIAGEDHWYNPTFSQETSNFQETLKTLSSQAFLSQVKSMKGMGSLSDAEGKKLEAGLQSLSLRQSPDRLMSNIKEIQRLMLKARDNISTKYGAPGKPSELRPGVAQKTIVVDW